LYSDGEWKNSKNLEIKENAIKELSVKENCSTFYVC
jgi:hypothetical protein